ncbi:hypothetical protein MXB_5628 [Myxobolus squamalis]|nr:hypothetical protein MXB_5628 [Myxobolus squamalis]
MIQSIDSFETAMHVNNALLKHSFKNVNVLIQVKISNENSKSGCPPSGISRLAQFIVENCEKLIFRGLMTIGSIEQSNAAENEEFGVNSTCVYQDT